MRNDKPLSHLNDTWLISWIYQPFSVLTDTELADYIWNYLVMLNQKYN